MNALLNLPLGWLSPSGEFTECKSFEHITVASDLVDKLQYKRYDPNRYIPDDDVLIENGWVHITISDIMHKYAIFWNDELRLTSQQKIFLNKYFEDKSLVCSGALIAWEYCLDN